MSMTLKEVKGDVRFYTNEKGVLFQQLFDGAIEPVVDGTIQYREIEKDYEYLIRYELNGTCGFSVWSNGINLEDNFWTLESAQDYILHTLPRYCETCGNPVYFERSPEWEICNVCDQTFCSDCMSYASQLPTCKECADESF